MALWVKVKDYVVCYERVSQVVMAYNNLLPYMSLDYQTPTELHNFRAVPVRHWKMYSERKKVNQEREKRYKGLTSCLIDHWPINYVWTYNKEGK